MDEKNEVKKQKDKVLCEKEEMLGEVDVLKEQLEEEKGEKEVIQKKYMNVKITIITGNKAAENCFAPRNRKT